VARSAIRKFTGWPPADRILLLRAVVALTAVKLALRLAGFARVSRFVAKSGASNRAALPSAPAIERIAWAVETAGAHLPGCANCLVKAMAAQYLLTRFRYQAELKIGACRTDAGEFAAHAWLESEEKVIIGDFELERYTALAGRDTRALKLDQHLSSSRGHQLQG
jgi:hypothetical protein